MSKLQIQVSMQNVDAWKIAKILKPTIFGQTKSFKTVLKGVFNVRRT